ATCSPSSQSSWGMLSSTGRRISSSASAACRRPPGPRGWTWSSRRRTCGRLWPPRRHDTSSFPCSAHLSLPHSTARRATSRRSSPSRCLCSPWCSPPVIHSTRTSPARSPLLNINVSSTDSSNMQAEPVDIQEWRSGEGRQVFMVESKSYVMKGIKPQFAPCSKVGFE
ncbi:unnamed protein product, partial [Musa acuminata var. zebrina]